MSKTKGAGLYLIGILGYNYRSYTVPQAAVWALGEIKAKRAIPHLIRALTDASEFLSVRELLNVVAIGHTVIAQDVAVIPKTLNNSGGR